MLPKLFKPLFILSGDLGQRLKADHSLFLSNPFIENSLPVAT
jgi:hypothetical protein